MPEPSTRAPVRTDVLVIGAGPCGLFQVFELGLLGIHAHVIDTLPEPGGQCSMLYPEKPIYDIPGLPKVLGAELIERLLEQVRPFAPDMHLGEEVVALDRKDDGVFDVRTSSGTVLQTRAVVIAGGLGSFQARPLRVEGAERFVGRNLEYRVTDQARYAGKRVCILGGGDSALDWAIALYDLGATVSIVHRRDAFRAAPATVAHMKSLAESDPERMRWFIGRVKELMIDGDDLAGVRVAPFAAPGDRDSGDRKDDAPAMTEVGLDELLVFYGLSPSLGHIAEWGLDGDRRHLAVAVETCQTNEPGVYAIGDISTYPGKKKLILSGFHEAAMAAYAIRKYLDPDAKDQVQYTTTSSELQRRLGVREA